MIYGKAPGNLRRTAILYRNKFPNRNVPNMRNFMLFTGGAGMNFTPSDRGVQGLISEDYPRRTNICR